MVRWLAVVGAIVIVQIHGMVALASADAAEASASNEIGASLDFDSVIFDDEGDTSTVTGSSEASNGDEDESLVRSSDVIAADGTGTKDESGVESEVVTNAESERGSNTGSGFVESLAEGETVGLKKSDDIVDEQPAVNEVNDSSTTNGVETLQPERSEPPAVSSDTVETGLDVNDTATESPASALTGSASSLNETKSPIKLEGDSETTPLPSAVVPTVISSDVFAASSSDVDHQASSGSTGSVHGSNDESSVDTILTADSTMYSDETSAPEVTTTNLSTIDEELSSGTTIPTQDTPQSTKISPSPTSGSTPSTASFSSLDNTSTLGIVVAKPGPSNTLPAEPTTDETTPAPSDGTAASITESPNEVPAPTDSDGADSADPAASLPAEEANKPLSDSPAPAISAESSFSSSTSASDEFESDGGSEDDALHFTDAHSPRNAEPTTVPEEPISLVTVTPDNNSAIRTNELNTPEVTSIPKDSVESYSSEASRVQEVPSSPNEIDEPGSIDESLPQIPAASNMVVGGSPATESPVDTQPHHDGSKEFDITVDPTSSPQGLVSEATSSSSAAPESHSPAHLASDQATDAPNHDKVVSSTSDDTTVNEETTASPLASTPRAEVENELHSSQGIISDDASSIDVTSQAPEASPTNTNLPKAPESTGESTDSRASELIITTASTNTGSAHNSNESSGTVDSTSHARPDENGGGHSQSAQDSVSVTVTPTKSDDSTPRVNGTPASDSPDIDFSSNSVIIIDNDNANAAAGVVEPVKAWDEQSQNEVDATSTPVSNTAINFDATAIVNELHNDESSKEASMEPADSAVGATEPSTSNDDTPQHDIAASDVTNEALKPDDNFSDATASTPPIPSQEIPESTSEDIYGVTASGLANSAPPGTEQPTSSNAVNPSITDEIDAAVDSTIDASEIEETTYAIIITEGEPGVTSNAVSFATNVEASAAVVVSTAVSGEGFDDQHHEEHSGISTDTEVPSSTGTPRATDTTSSTITELVDHATDLMYNTTTKVDANGTNGTITHSSENVAVANNNDKTNREENHVSGLTVPPEQTLSAEPTNSRNSSSESQSRLNFPSASTSGTTNGSSTTDFNAFASSVSPRSSANETEKPNNSSISEAQKPTVSTSAYAADNPTTLSESFSKITTSELTGSGVLDENAKAKPYVRGQTTIGAGVVVTGSQEAELLGGASGAGSNGDPLIIGGRKSRVTSTQSGLYASSTSSQNIARYAACAASIFSFVLLVGFHLLYFDDRLKWPTHSPGTYWSPNTWEFVAYVGYLQQTMALSPMTLMQTPYFLWEFTDIFAWTNLLVYRNPNSDSPETRRLNVIILNSLVGYADRIGTDEANLIYTVDADFAIALGVVLSVALVLLGIARYRDKDQDVSEKPSVSIVRRVLSLLVLLWFFALFPLALVGSFEVSMEMQSSMYETGPLMLSLIAVVGISAGGFAIAGRALFHASSVQLSQPKTQATWGVLYLDHKHKLRLFFVFTASLQVVTGLAIGFMRAGKTLLVLLLVLHTTYLLALYSCAPFKQRAALAQRFAYTATAVKMVNVLMMFAFLETVHMAVETRCQVARAFIIMNCIVLFAWLLRLLVLFCTCVAVLTRREEESKCNLDPDCEVGIMRIDGGSRAAPSRESVGGEGEGVVVYELRHTPLTSATSDSLPISHPLNGNSTPLSRRWENSMTPAGVAAML